ncbi:hypothetical protein L1987_25671 [Smallanthus sonchifolius]|uniref:Uncharacterized protein n=1 Tax=Smallanthus sonchifolius TaxID=185202 RepID=A0ACB9I9T8_9ASTR|nr:hypothetical protein L1987_25671 [Smallanthus sonchifolius]
MAGVSAKPLSALLYPSLQFPKSSLNPTRLRFQVILSVLLHLALDIEAATMDDFVYGVYDEHHTYYEGDDKSTFWGSIKEDYAAINPPTGFQGLISWLFLPSVALGMYLNVPVRLTLNFSSIKMLINRKEQGEYLYIGAAIFTVIFCIIEMDKPSEAYNFEPQIYKMERGARDKLISDYNTIDIWDFNEKYGDLWDFTVTKDDIMKR